MSDSALGLLLLVGLAGCGAQQSDLPMPPRAENASPTEAPSDAAATSQKIIHRATIVLRVEDFGQTEKKLGELVQAAGGYVAAFHEDRSSGAQRGGRWTIRVPVTGYARFIEQAGLLGIAEQRETHADDVTEEYVDLGARLKNKQQLEARLLEMVAKRSDEIKDVLALETELARVREEIERMQGRLRFLNDRVALTTVEIAAYERLGFQPPLATTFAGRIGQTFSDSVGALRKCGEAAVLVVVGLAPWLAAFLLVVMPFIVWARRYRRRARTVVVAQAI